MPMRSIIALLPRSTEKDNRTHGRYGAVKANKPRKLMRTKGFLRAQTYTIINVRDDPRKCILTNGAIACSQEACVAGRKMRTARGVRVNIGAKLQQVRWTSGHKAYRHYKGAQQKHIHKV